jgi:hypothetical protein
MSHILPHKVERIEAPFVVACEGYNDVCLIDKLIDQCSITNCRTGCPSRTGVGGEGKDYLGQYLSAIDFAAAKDTQRTMRGLLLIVDADESPDKAFSAACNALRFAAFPVPDSAFTLIDDNGIRTAIYIVPGVNKEGTLEHLLLRTAFEKTPASEACVDAFLACVDRSTHEKPNTVAKMKMSALVAASFPVNPWATPGMLLQSSKNDLISFDSGHFKHLADFLVGFCTE